MKKIILIIIIASILISGCSGGARSPQIPPIYSGSEGVVVEFMKNVPPQKLYENQVFELIVNVHNKGAYSINGSTINEKGVVHVDYDPLYFSQVILKESSFVLRSKSLDFPKGESVMLDLGQMKVNEILGTRVSPKTKIYVSVCYPYQTYLSKEVCIDQDYMKVQKTPVCTNPGTYTFSSQGAPVAITKIEADMLPLGNGVTQPVFRITLRNIGKGIVITRQDGIIIDNLCSPARTDSNPKNFNILKVSAWLGSEDNQLKCEPENAILWDNEVEVTCTSNPIQAVTVQDPERPISDNNHISILTVKADYVYKENINREIEINRIER